MKLLMFRHDGQPRLGALRPGHEDEVVDLSEVARDLLAVIDAGERGLEHVGKAAAGANIPRSEAMGYVFGYFVLNDVSARDIQNGWGGQYFKGKSLDRSCPIGPWVVTADEAPDPRSLGLRLTVNGVVKQDGNTRDMIHPVDSIIEWASKGMTLLPGALIATGTPDGVGFARKPPEFLHPGDLMETEVEGIGLLRNRIVAAKVGALADHAHRGA